MILRYIFWGAVSTLHFYTVLILSSRFIDSLFYLGSLSTLYGSLVSYFINTVFVFRKPISTGRLGKFFIGILFISVINGYVIEVANYFEIPVHLSGLIIVTTGALLGLFVNYAFVFK